MELYILLAIIAIFLIIVSYSNLYTDVIVRQLILWPYIIILSIIYIFRSFMVGSDYNMYHDIYENDTYYLLRAKFIEPGYSLLDYIARYFNNFLIISFFIFIVFMFGIILLKHTFNLNSFILISSFMLSYLYFLLFNIMRQAIAIGIICVGISLLFSLNKHKFIGCILFILCVFVAKQFHTTAIFCLIFLLLSHIYFGKKTVIISSIITSIFFYTNIIRNLFNKLLVYFPTYYIKDNNEISGLTTYGNKGIIQFIPVLCQFLFLYIFVFYYIKSDASKNNVIRNTVNKCKIRFILSGYLLYLVMYSAGGDVISDRLQSYTYIFVILFMCIFLNSSNYHIINKIPIGYKILFVCFWVIYYIGRLITNNSGIVPYHFLI